MEHGAWKVVDSFNEMHIFMLVKTGITTGSVAQDQSWETGLYVSFLTHVSSHGSVAKRLQWEVFDWAVLHSRGLEASRYMSTRYMVRTSPLRRIADVAATTMTSLWLREHGPLCV